MNRSKKMELIQTSILDAYRNYLAYNLRLAAEWHTAFVATYLIPNTRKMAKERKYYFRHKRKCLVELPDDFRTE